MKLLLLSLLSIIVNIAYINAQTVTNGSFENWSMITAYEEPDNMISQNIQAYFNTLTGNVVKSTDKVEGNYSVKMTTIITNGDTISGMVTNSSFGSDFSGGQAYTHQPDSFYFASKSNILPNDTALIGVFFKKNGSFIAIAMKKLVGTQATWKNYALNIHWIINAQPDTVIFIAASSDFDGSPKNGSELYLDDMNFGSGNGSLTNGGFENWSPKTFEDPTNWSTFNVASLFFPPAYAVQSTDAYNGNYALEITTKMLNNGDDTLAHVTNGVMKNSDWAGGQKVYSNPMKLSGYYKYTPIGNDSAIVAIRTTEWNNSTNTGVTVQEKFKTLGAATSYTYFEIDLNYNAWPTIDTIGILFASSNIYNGKANVGNGSKLLIDSLNITYYPVGINGQLENKINISTYPQPAINEVNFSFESNAQQVELLIYNSEGKLIATHKDNNLNTLRIETNSYNSGMYFYKIRLDGNLSSGKFQIVR